MKEQNKKQNEKQNEETKTIKIFWFIKHMFCKKKYIK